MIGDFMENTISLLPTEVIEISKLVQRLQALYCLKKVLEINPERVEFFGFTWDDFSELDKDLKEADIACQRWWSEIAEKHNLPQNAKFSVRYADCSLILL